MTQMIEDAKNLTIKEFGQAVITAQTAQIKQMELMLQRIK